MEPVHDMCIRHAWIPDIPLCMHSKSVLTSICPVQMPLSPNCRDVCTYRLNTTELGSPMIFVHGLSRRIELTTYYNIVSVRVLVKLIVSRII